MKFIVYIILICVAYFFINKYILSRFKFPKTNAITLVTGAVKGGKTTFAVGLAVNEWKKRYKRWRFVDKICKFLHIKHKTEMPLFYSFTPVKLPYNIGYVRVNDDILYRKKRMAFGSVMFVDELTLFMDKDIYKDEINNFRLQVFNKLFGHETHGGLLVYDTQSMSDIPAVVRRNITQYFYVHHTTALPFFLPILCYVRECIYSEDSTTINSFGKDVENDLQCVILRKSTWKRFDTYCFSELTDNLPVENELYLPKNLKSSEIVGFNTKFVNYLESEKNAKKKL